jgi:hypothetical protein
LTDTTPPVPASRQGLRLRLVLAVMGMVVLALALALYAARRTLAREALTAWLKSKGVAATAEVHAIGPASVTGALTIGDAGHPDLTVERAQIGYGLKGLGLEVRSIALVRPVLRARLHDGKVSAGELDPLIAEFRKAPPRPGAVQPRIEIKNGILLLATDYGPVRVDVDGRLDDGKLQQLTARVAPTRLHGDRFDVSLGEVCLGAKAAGAQVEISLDAPIASAQAGQAQAAGARLTLTATAPYPDLKAHREDGSVAAHAELSGGRLAVAGHALRNGLASAVLTGRASGWIDDLVVTGRATADLRAAGAEAVGGLAGPLRATAGAEDLRWTRKGGDAVQAKLAVSGTLDTYAQGDLKFATVTAGARGPLSANRRGVDFELASSVAGHGAWNGLGAPIAGDSVEIAAAKRAAGGFRFAAPAVRVRSTRGSLYARLVQPVRLLPDRGGAVTLAPAGRGWRLTAAGGGLPKVDADISRFALVPGGAAADGRIKAALSIGPIEQGTFDASGGLRLAGGELSFTGDRCAQVAARRLNFGGANDVLDFRNRLCPAGGPLLAMGGGDWRILGRAEDTAADVPFLQAKIAKGAGLLDLGSRRGELQAKMTVAGAQVIDAAPQTRFVPVGLSGRAQLARNLWTGQLGVHDGAGRPLATIRLKHEVLSGRGGADVETGTLRFAPGGLQPAALSPIAALIGSPAEGEARFTGGFAWTPQAQTSSGVLEVPRLDFISPAGKVNGLSGRVAFSSLAPLVAAPGQKLQAVSIASPLGPVAEARAVFGLQPDALRVSDGQAAIGGGLIRIDSLVVPLTPKPIIHGVLELQGLQLHDLVEASPFGDKVDLTAKVSGRMPFTLDGDKVRIQRGSLHAIEPGRLSIQRTALTGVQAAGAVETPGAPEAVQAAVQPDASTDTISDFAYQAMENLAFSTLSAEVDSRPDGRLAVLFHIVGKHDPPQRQVIRLTLMDLIQKKFLNRQLPLPSGTGVNLTLDTTLNLDDLLADYAEFRRLQGSATVQP